MVATLMNPSELGLNPINLQGFKQTSIVKGERVDLAKTEVPLTKMVASAASDISGTGLPLSVLLAKNETDMGGRGGK